MQSWVLGREAEKAMLQRSDLLQLETALCGSARSCGVERIDAPAFCGVRLPHSAAFAEAFLYRSGYLTIDLCFLMPKALLHRLHLPCAVSWQHFHCVFGRLWFSIAYKPFIPAVICVHQGT